MRVIISTPHASTRSSMPAPTSPAASVVACWLEPHWLSTVVAATSCGSPCASHAVRAMLNDCSPTCERTRQSADLAGRFAQVDAAFWAAPSRSAGWSHEPAPRRPMGKSNGFDDEHFVHGVTSRRVTARARGVSSDAEPRMTPVHKPEEGDVGEARPRQHEPARPTSSGAPMNEHQGQTGAGKESRGTDDRLPSTPVAATPPPESSRRRSQPRAAAGGPVARDDREGIDGTDALRVLSTGRRAR
jgi:hypothetical protein